MLSPRGVALSICFLGLWFAMGCGEADKIGPTFPVEGDVTLGDAPLKTGTITFHPDSATGNKCPTIGTGNIENGKFKIAMGTKTGAPAGVYKVTIESTAPSNPKDEYSSAVSVINELYRDVKTTTLTAEVKEGATYNFKVTK